MGVVASTLWSPKITSNDSTSTVWLIRCQEGCVGGLLKLLAPTGVPKMAPNQGHRTHWEYLIDALVLSSMRCYARRDTIIAESTWLLC